ncbi:succinylglutamate desuccinylase/aspartoacylase family protein [Methanobrevibacter sp. OttesenSCG-928-K11]|nr:succinylglutamate desuccinylase/aspartoacylase family protein [Methanobrevibacter sp. OttesenSCG-928-K11]MDL2270817.1 succinylglutamate desuccinylase/aspartoacylase family protein [Methanobrevibacter sp. OttesenSCG-928-I08]
MKFEKVLDSEIQDNYNNNIKLSYVSKESGAYVFKNKFISSSISLSPSTNFVLNKALYGTPIFKFGNNGDKLILVSGVHGNELSSQVASLFLFEHLLNLDFDGVIYLIPFAAPLATMNNSRRYNSKDLNRSAFIEGSITNEIIKIAENLKVDAVADFHTTALNSNPGRESIFCSENPTKESLTIANHINNDVGSVVINFDKAGFPYKGAIEDESNLKGIPSITCEVLSPFGSIKKGSIERSYLQMKSFLSYFNI